MCKEKTMFNTILKTKSRSYRIKTQSFTSIGKLVSGHHQRHAIGRDWHDHTSSTKTNLCDCHCKIKLFHDDVSNI